ncbi:unnamed protein product [Rotaria sp. Silwood2]|nr:unnamed protein product [Rotaria sp. Silwood2]
MIFLFRAFISDIQCQLKNHQIKNSLRVYRGQRISTDEVKTLKQYLGQFISLNSFFSTSTDYRQALSFLNDPNAAENLEPVLFEIVADPKVATTKPFADISAFSEFPGESEILFMLGSIFRLDNVNHSSDDQVWIILMTLCSEKEHDLKNVLMYTKYELGCGQTNLRTLGKLLWQMGKLNLAEQYFTRLLKELSPNDPLLSDLYEDLGKIASHTGDYDKSVQWHKKSLALKNPNALAGVFNDDESSNSIVIPSIPANVQWAQNGATVAGGHGEGDATNQFNEPGGLFVDDGQTMVIADFANHRIIQWKIGDANGQVIAGGNGKGNGLDQLCWPIDVLIDNETDSLIICDLGNRRAVRWSRCSGITQGEILIDNIGCFGLAMDHQRNLYVSDFGKDEVRRYQIGDKNGTLVAGGYGQGDGLNQLNVPTYVFVDQHQSVYVSDRDSHRVMKWNKGPKEGIIVAAGQGEGNALTQLWRPNGLFIDTLDTIYVADLGNHRVMRWPKGAKQGPVIVGGNGLGEEANQFNSLEGLSFDRHGNLHVVDYYNHRVQRFSIE